MKKLLSLFIFVFLSLYSCRVSKDVIYIPKLKKSKISLKKYNKNFIDRISRKDLRTISLDTTLINNNY